MIFTWLGQLICGFVALLVTPIPNVVWNPDFTGFAAAVGVIKELDNGLPITEWLAMLGITLSVSAGMLIWRGIRAVKAWIPTLGGSDD